MKGRRSGDTRRIKDSVGPLCTTFDLLIDQCISVVECHFDPYLFLYLAHLGTHRLQTRVSSVLLNQEKQQMLLTVGLCVLATAVLLAAIALFLVRRRYQAQQKIKGLTQSIDGEATRDYQVRISYLLTRRAHIISSAPSTSESSESRKGVRRMGYRGPSSPLCTCRVTCI